MKKKREKDKKRREKKGSIFDNFRNVSIIITGSQHINIINNSFSGTTKVSIDIFGSTNILIENNKFQDLDSLNLGMFSFYGYLLPSPFSKRKFVSKCTPFLVLIEFRQRNAYVIFLPPLCFFDFSLPSPLFPSLRTYMF